MKTIQPPLWALAALTLLPATARAQDSPQRERMRAEMERMTQQMRERGLDVRPFAQAARPESAAPAAAGWRIGVMADPVDPLLRTHLKLPKDCGLVVDRVVEGGPAAKAGLAAGDLILAAGDKPVGSLDALRGAVIRAAESGQPLVLKVMKEGKSQQVRIQPPAKPKPAAEAARHPERPAPRGGRIDAPPAEPGKPMPDHAAERIGRALHEMRADLDKQREAIRRLEKRVEELGRKRD